MFAYCGDNPVVNVDCSGTRYVKGLFGDGSENRSSTTSVKNNVVQANKFKLYNHIERTHITSPQKMIDDIPFLGKIGISKTITIEDQEPAFFYTYMDKGNDCIKAGSGINAFGWFGVHGGMHNINANIGAQLTPWFHVDGFVGLDGIGASFGVDIKSVSIDFEVTCGWGTIFMFLFPLKETSESAETKRKNAYTMGY